MAEQDPTQVGEQGLYTVSMAARILGAKADKVRSWVEGYKHSSAEPILVRQLPRVGDRVVLGFLDLVESAFVRHFRSLGYSAQTIRKVAIKLRDKHNYDHPFAMNMRFRADGKYIFEEVADNADEVQLVNLMNDNFEMVDLVRPSLFDQIFYVQDVASKWSPLPEFPRVIIDPKISFGRPVLNGIWIPTDTLTLAAKAEQDTRSVAEEFGIAPEDVLTAVRFENALSQRVLH